MVDRSDRIDAILCAAVELATPDERADYLRAQCGDDEELRVCVEDLLEAHFRAGTFLEHPVASLTPEADLPLAEQPGTTIGRYKLLEPIGEGGFAVVFMAEQQQPVRRRVAVKVIKAGMDTRQVVVRFEAERQALAMMDHPNIARVFDGGATEAGRPYFVMELVKGTAVTHFCDEHRLSVDARLDLFIQVCQAVEHAHQKGIIHRDLKPNNVLVCMHDERPLVKVIDFGIAKATETRLTDKTLFTDVRQLIGTPSYMSPEQAEGSLDIDTRSDVYSLGVLLYELLAGAPPFNRKELRSKALAEMQRIIRDLEPPTPSARLSALNHNARSLKAAQRQVDPKRLIQRLRGELDWIVMRAMEKDRGRRYQSAMALADDVRRYLGNEPVEARPAATIYRFGKFARRNKGVLITLGLIGITLAAATLVSTWQAVRASIAEQRASADARRAEAISEFLVEAFRSPDPERDGRTITIVEVLDRTVQELKGKYEDQPTVRATLLDAIGSTYNSLGLPADSVPLLEEAFHLQRETLGESAAETLSTMGLLALGYSRVDRDAEAVALGERVLQLRRRLSGEDAPETLTAMRRLSTIYRSANRAVDAIPHAMSAVEKLKVSQGPEAYDTLVAMHEAIAAHGDAMGQGENVTYPFLFDDIYPIVRRQFPKDHPFTLAVMDNVAYSALQQGQLDYAGELLEEVLTLRLEKLGPEHQATLRVVKSICTLAERRVDPRQASKDLELVTRIAPDNPNVKAAKTAVEARLRPFDAMVDDYVQRIETAQDERWTDSPRKKVCRELAAMPDVFDAVAERLPDETALWIGRGQYYMQRNRLEEAEADYARVIQQRSFQDEHYEYGCLLLLRDEAAYQAYCQELYEGNRIPTDGYSAYIFTRLAGIGPARCVSPADLIERAEYAAADRKPWQLHALGVAYLHAGNYDAARKTLRELVTGSGTRSSENWFPLAIAAQKLGDVDEARHCLEFARRAYRNAVPPRQGEPACLAVPSEWLLLQCLIREAETLLGGESTASSATHTPAGKESAVE